MRSREKWLKSEDVVGCGWICATVESAGIEDIYELADLCLSRNGLGNGKKSFFKDGGLLRKDYLR